MQLPLGLLLTLPFQQGFDSLELVARSVLHRLLFAATAAKLWRGAAHGRVGAIEMCRKQQIVIDAR